MTQDAGTPPLLRAALEQLRLEGAIFFRAELTGEFSVESKPNAVAGAVHPGAERLILFHIVARGSCRVYASDGAGERHWATQGDVIVVPYGDDHMMESETPAECVPIATLMDAPPWQRLPHIRHGGEGPTTEIVCGYLVCDDPLFDPAMRVFPPVFVVRLPEGAASGWVQASVVYAIEQTDPGRDGSGPGDTRLAELVLIEVLRLNLASAPAADHGLLAALHDPVVAPTLARLHAQPDRRWTVAALAREAAVSRSLLDERFRQLLGRPPIRYLTEWRIHLAEELLATTDLTVAAVGRRVGYDSEEAFSRAFKRARELPPSHWRADRRRTRI
jgi:AraC-like DNA-binding protein